jgi:hypothetical protein
MIFSILGSTSSALEVNQRHQLCFFHGQSYGSGETAYEE